MGERTRGQRAGRIFEEVVGGAKAMKAVVKYPGSKWSIADWIISFFPEHHSYLEPFFGSGAVLFNKERSNIETVNDLDGNVVNLFEWIKKDPERLAREIYYTPYARQVYEEAFRRTESNSLYKAVNFAVKCQMGYGIRTNGKTGWKNDIQGREKAYGTKDWAELPDRIMKASERLRGVQIECKQAIDVIERYDFENVLIYCDPPYMLETRSQKQYKNEMTKEDHQNLLEVLKKSKGHVVISGYDSKLYNDILRGWNKQEIVCRTQSSKKSKEVIWMNFEPEEQQMTLKDYI